MSGKHKNDEVIKALYEKFELTPEDVFTKEVGNRVHYRIITRRGIDKIQAKSDAKLDWHVTYESDDCVRIDITATKEGVIPFHTNGEADRHNVKQQPAYLAAMALARAKSRAILGIEDFYKHGFMGVDEADEFKEIVNKGGSKKEASIKTGPSLSEIPKGLSNF